MWNIYMFVDCPLTLFCHLSNCEFKWDALEEEVRQEREARLKQEEEMRKEKEARLLMERRQKVFEAFMKQFNDGNPPVPPCQDINYIHYIQDNTVLFIF